jgi:hypothetical protein
LWFCGQIFSLFLRKEFIVLRDPKHHERVVAQQEIERQISEFAAAAASAAFLSAVFLFGVPRWRPPRLSPGFDPLGIAIFRRLYYLG